MRFILMCFLFGCTASKDEDNDDTSHSPSDEASPTDTGGDNGGTTDDCESEMGTFEGQVLFAPPGCSSTSVPFADIIVTPSN